MGIGNGLKMVMRKRTANMWVKLKMDYQTGKVHKHGKILLKNMKVNGRVGTDTGKGQLSIRILLENM